MYTDHLGSTAECDSRLTGKHFYIESTTDNSVVVYLNGIKKWSYHLGTNEGTSIEFDIDKIGTIQMKFEHPEFWQNPVKRGKCEVFHSV